MITKKARSELNKILPTEESFFSAFNISDNLSLEILFQYLFFRSCVINTQYVNKYKCIVYRADVVPVDKHAKIISLMISQHRVQ